jgi:hypothetical protein
MTSVILSAMTSPVNVNMGISGDPKLYVKCENEAFQEIDLGNKLGIVEQILIITPYRFSDTVKLPSSPDQERETLHIDCIVSPMFAGKLPLRFTSNNPARWICDELREQVTQMATTLAPQVFSWERNEAGWQASLCITHKGIEYITEIQYS